MAKSIEMGFRVKRNANLEDFQTFFLIFLRSLLIKCPYALSNIGYYQAFKSLEVWIPHFVLPTPPPRI